MGEKKCRLEITIIVIQKLPVMKNTKTTQWFWEKTNAYQTSCWRFSIAFWIKLLFWQNSTVEPLPMRVFLWPGYGTEEEDPKEDIFPTEPFTGAPYAAPGGCFHPICPRGSVCIPSYECPSCSIHYIKDMASTRLKVCTRIIDGWPMQCMYFIVVYRGWVRPTQPLFNFNYASCFITHTSNQYLYCCCFIAVSFNQFSLQFLCGVSLGTEG